MCTNNFKIWMQIFFMQIGWKTCPACNQYIYSLYFFPSQGNIFFIIMLCFFIIMLCYRFTYAQCKTSIIFLNKFRFQRYRMPQSAFRYVTQFFSTRSRMLRFVPGISNWFLIIFLLSVFFLSRYYICYLNCFFFNKN